MQNLHQLFVLCTASQIIGGDFSKNSALASKGRILSNISFVFWAMEFQEKLLFRWDLQSYLAGKPKIANTNLIFMIFMG